MRLAVRRASLLFLLLVSACGTRPSPSAATSAPAASPPASAPSASPPAATRPPPPTASPASARELIVCLPSEPRSLHLYARPEPGRDHILAALYDGPIDSAGYGFQPVILQKLPSLADGDAEVRLVTVSAGDRVVDALGRVVQLAPGTSLLQPDGAVVTFTAGSVTVPQVTATFRLKPGLMWSDGRPLQAADSVFSFEISRSPDVFNPRRDVAERTASYRALDALAVVWTGLPGHLDPLYATRFWTPLPRHVYAGLTPAQIGDDLRANTSPLGWGPFVLREWAPGDHLTVERNPRYFRAAEGLPVLDRVVYRFTGLDAAGLLAEVRAGGCDVVPQNPAFDAEPGLLLAEGAPVQFASAGVLEHLDFGITPAAGYERGAGVDFFQDVRARQALAHCLDRAALARLAGLPLEWAARPPAAYLPPGHPLLASDAVAYPFDPARSRDLLFELGWADSDGDGVLDRQGTPLRLSLAGGPAGGPLREGLLAEVAAQLRANCGVEAEARLLTRGELAGDWPDGVVFGRRFDLAVFGWRVGVIPPCGLYTSGQIPGAQNPGGANAAGYASADFDAACSRALAALAPERAAVWHADAQRLFALDLPMLPLFFWPKFSAARLGVQGVMLDPTSASELWNLEAARVAP